MKIWQLVLDVENYDNLLPAEGCSVEELQSYDGRAHIEEWEPIKVERMYPEKRLELGDAPGFSYFPVFSNKALDVLLPLIREHVEVLPLDFAEKPLFGINVTTVLDAIDYEKSRYRTFRDGKRIMAFQKYAFRTNVIEGVHIFKISDEKVRRAFVSEQFKNLVDDYSLKGFNLRLVWNSDE